MAKEVPHNRVITFVRHGKKLRMAEAKEMDWQFIIAGEGYGSGRQKKDVEEAFYLNSEDVVIMQWRKPLKVGTPILEFKQAVEDLSLL